MEENDFVSIWLEESGNPAIEQLVQLNLDTAKKITQAMTHQALSVQDISIMLDINAEEIQRWLSDRHTFSLNTIKQIAAILETTSA